MLSREDVRQAALSLPEAYEAPHFEAPSYRVKGKIFCAIHAERPRALLKLTPEDQHNLVDGVVLTPVEGAWGRKGWTYLWYEKLAPERMPDLVRLAWATVAPKRLLKGA